MGETVRNGKKIFAITTYFKPGIWKKLKAKRRAMEKKEGRRISDSELLRILCLKATGVK